MDKKKCIDPPALVKVFIIGNLTKICFIFLLLNLITTNVNEQTLNFFLSI